MEQFENQSVNTRIDKECADNLEAEFEFLNRLGVWSFLMNSTV